MHVSPSKQVYCADDELVVLLCASLLHFSHDSSHDMVFIGVFRYYQERYGRKTRRWNGIALEHTYEKMRWGTAPRVTADHCMSQEESAES